MKEALREGDGDDCYEETTTVLPVRDADNKWKVRYLGVFFMVLLTSMQSFFLYSSMVFRQLGYDKMGMLSIATFFVSSAVGTIISPWLSRKFQVSYAKKFFVAAFPHFLILSTGVVASSCLVEDGSLQVHSSSIVCSSGLIYMITILASSLCGLANALLWVLQGAYVTECTSEFNKGELFGTFLQLSQMSTVTSPLLSSLLFGNFTTFGFFLVQSTVTLVGAFLAFMIREPYQLTNQHLNELENLRKNSEYDSRTGKEFEHYKALNSQLLRRSSSMSFVDGVGVTPEMGGGNSASTTDLLKKLRTFITEQYQIKYYFTVFFLNGFFLGYYWSQMGFLAGAKLTQTTEEEQSQANEQLGIMFLLMGITQILITPRLGRSFDELVEKTIFFKRIIIVAFAAFSLVLASYFLPFFAPFYLVSVLFGLGEMLIKSFIGGVLSLKFQKHSYEAFATYRLISNIASGVAMILSVAFTPEVPLVMLSALFLSIAFCFVRTNDIYSHLDRPAFVRA